MAAMAERTWDVDAAQAVFVVQVFRSWLSVNWFPALGRSPRRVCIRELETGRRRSARYGFGPPSSHNSSVSRQHQRLREYFVACARRTRVSAALDAGRRRLL